MFDLDADELLSRVESKKLPELGQVLPVTRRRISFERYLKLATYLIVTVAIVPPLVYFFVAGGARMLDRNSGQQIETARLDRKSTRLNSSHVAISYAVFCLKKKKSQEKTTEFEKAS